MPPGTTWPTTWPRLRVKVNVEIVTDLRRWRRGLGCRAYDLALSIRPTSRWRQSSVVIYWRRCRRRTPATGGVVPVEGECPGSHARRSRQTLSSGFKPVASPDANSITAWLIPGDAARRRGCRQDHHAAAGTPAIGSRSRTLIENGLRMGRYCPGIDREGLDGGGWQVIAVTRRANQNPIVATSLGRSRDRHHPQLFRRAWRTAPTVRPSSKRSASKRGFITYDQNNCVAIAAWLGM